MRSLNLVILYLTRFWLKMRSLRYSSPRVFQIDPKQPSPKIERNSSLLLNLGVMNSFQTLILQSQAGECSKHNRIQVARKRLGCYWLWEPDLIWKSRNPSSTIYLTPLFFHIPLRGTAKKRMEGVSFVYETLAPLTATADPPLDLSEPYSVFRTQISASDSVSPNLPAPDYFSLDLSSPTPDSPAPPPSRLAPTRNDPSSSSNSSSLERAWFRSDGRFKSPMLRLHKGTQIPPSLPSLSIASLIDWFGFFVFYYGRDTRLLLLCFADARRTGVEGCRGAAGFRGCQIHMASL